MLLKTSKISKTISFKPAKQTQTNIVAYFRGLKKWIMWNQIKYIHHFTQGEVSHEIESYQEAFASLLGSKWENHWINQILMSFVHQIKLSPVLPGDDV